MGQQGHCLVDRGDRFFKGGQLHSMIFDPDDNIWFTEITSDKIGKLDTHIEKLTLTVARSQTR